ncbi:MAG: prepilin-type N-terminal cleavage/methylation domain-containing protein [Opitutales bacterium]|nr:prepilin-type N-terminal cleavage/methylation domain-containing protein [Opitutales bacterium]
MSTLQTTAKARPKGFTIAELLVALTISAFVFMGLFQFTFATSRMLFDSTAKIDVNRDVRMFTQHMTNYARAANQFYIYKSFDFADRDDSDDRKRDGESGDFLLLIYQEPWPDPDDTECITRLVGYFRKPDGSGDDATGPVYRFEIVYSSSNYKNTLTNTPESLIAHLSASGDYDQVWELSRGMADGKLFYNFFDRSIMIKAELYRGNNARRISDTYNFTVSPRG